MPLTLGSLFDGLGGWLLAAKESGVKPLWSSEIDEFPMAVSKYHFPNVEQLGDITKINGADVEPVDIICAGSPCQDLSTAGKRAGLAGERSSLFRDAIRIVREMREATNGDDVAWRTLDAQYWGVPQCRARIFLVADFRAERRPEVLFESESLRGDSTQGKGKGQDSAGSFGESIEPANRTWNIGGYNSNSMKSDNPYSGIGETSKSRTLDLNGGNPACNQGGTVVLEGNGARPSHKGDGYRVSDTSYTLNTVEQHGVAYGITSQKQAIGSLCSSDYKGVGNQYVSDGKLVIEGK